MSSYYALTARHDGEKERTCALIPSASIHGAERAARDMRLSGALGFVESGSRFRIRGASRTEVSLLRRFLHSCHLDTQADRAGADFDGLLVRRQRLLLSFFLGLYIDPLGLRARLAGVVDPSAPGSGASGSGGIERAVPQATHGVDQTATEAAKPATESESADGPIAGNAQEETLAGLLASSEANDGGAGRDSGYDLDDLF